MREELSVAHSIISFDSLGDLLSELDESIETYSKLTKRYEDRLGMLLRQAKESNDPNLQAVSVALGSSSGQTESDQQEKNKKKKEDKRRDVEERGWIVLEAEIMLFAWRMAPTRKSWQMKSHCCSKSSRH